MTSLNMDYYNQDDWFDKSGRQTTWSASYYTTLQKCKRYHYYTALKGWRAKQKSVDLIFGGVFSAAVEMYYKLFTAGTPAEDCLAEVVHAVLIESKKHKVFATEELKTRRALVRAVIDYFDTYIELDGPHVKYSEQVFRIPVADDIWFTGKLDLVKAREDEYEILDQKTTKSTLSPMYFQNYTPNNQMSMYLYAGRMVFPLPVRVIILDAVQIMKTGTKLLRGVVSRTKSQLNEWAAGAVHEIRSSWELDPDDEAAWPQNPNACGYFRGCEFRHVCSADPKIREAYLRKDFQNGKDQ